MGTSIVHRACVDGAHASRRQAGAGRAAAGAYDFESEELEDEGVVPGVDELLVFLSEEPALSPPDDEDDFEPSDDDFDPSDDDFLA